MTQVYGALLLVGAYFGASFLALFSWNDLGSVLLSRYCEAAELASGPCQETAMVIAAQGFAAILMVAIVTAGMAQKSLRDSVITSPDVEPFEASPGLMLLLITAVAVVLIAHNIHHAPTGSKGYRFDERALVSMESLAWPLLLQLIFWSRQIRYQWLLTGFLVAIVAISPFRNALFSIIYFGVLVPFAALLAAGKPLAARTRIMGLAGVSVVVLVILFGVIYQTERRVSRHAEESTHIKVAKVEEALAFRAFAPFFGAVYIDHLARSNEPLPNFLASLKEKFRLATNLNEYAYNKLFGGQSPYQETTLYYGESVANTSISPIYWQFAAPLALVLIYFLMRPVCDISVLIGIALWRSSMSGLFDILIALVLQVGFCVVLSYLQNRTRGPLAEGARRRAST